MSKKEKPILAIETSEKLCSVCVYFSSEKYFQLDINLKNSHSELLLDAIDHVLSLSKVKLNELGWIAISAGPGSFTGLRIGMSAAKGIAYGSSLPLLPVPTFEALAMQICQYVPLKTKFVIANKFNSEEIYYAKFINELNNYKPLEELRIIKLEELKRNSEKLLIFGNIISKISGGEILEHNRVSAPEAYYIANWSKRFGSSLLTFDYEFLEPNYLKEFIIKEKKHV